MTDRISRRDFLNGTALMVAGGMLPVDQLRAQPPAAYPPGLQGLRGNHDGSFDVAHALAREGKKFAIDALSIDETYDLVVVGAGLAGLSAAWFYRQRRPNAKILILDNHDDFGGHAKRNEFNVGGRLILGYGGSESLVAPRSKFKKRSKAMFKSLGLNPERFYSEDVFHRKLYPGLGLSRGVFFDAGSFGADKLVTGDPMRLGYDEFSPATPNARKIDAFLADCPLTPETRDGLLALFNGTRDPMAGQSTEQKTAKLAKTSYRAFVTDVCGLPKAAGDFFQGRPLDNFGLGADAISSLEAMGSGYPGAKGLALGKADLGGEGEDEEPYIHHFPDGNASLARMLVRNMIPGVAPGKSMTDIVTARFNYDRLDRAANKVRLRLNSTAVVVRNSAHKGLNGVAIGYVRGGKLARIQARHCIVAGYAGLTPHLVPELAQPQKNALSQQVKGPMLYSKVILRNWTSFARLGVHNIASPMGYHSIVKLDYPVSLGGYKAPRRPEEPIGLQLVHVPLAPNQGHTARDQMRIGRLKLFTTPFAEIETAIRQDLSRMLSPGGFDATRDIEAITVNRWSHGYSYSFSSLYDDVKAGEAVTMPTARAKAGRIAFANSDTAWSAYAHAAMDEAARAVDELTGKG